MYELGKRRIYISRNRRDLALGSKSNIHIQRGTQNALFESYKYSCSKLGVIIMKKKKWLKQKGKRDAAMLYFDSVELKWD